MGALAPCFLLHRFGPYFSTSRLDAIALGRVAIVITDNLKTHTSAGSLLVRSMLTELQEHLYVVYTPAYDPDANRIEWRLPGLATGGDA